MPLRFLAGGTGSSPRRSRSLTSRTVPGETPASSAILRREACGFLRRSSAARRRPAAGSSGRTFPSRPTRAVTSDALLEAARRKSRTVRGARPVTEATIRSDHSGWESRMRRAAAVRSGRVRGRPCRMFFATARAKASFSVPSKNCAEISVLPRSAATFRRCAPSITRIVARWTRMGGSSSTDSVRTLRWSGSSPRWRGESAVISELIGTGSGADIFCDHCRRSDASSVSGAVDSLGEVNSDFTQGFPSSVNRCRCRGKFHGQGAIQNSPDARSSLPVFRRSGAGALLRLLAEPAGLVLRPGVCWGAGRAAASVAGRVRGRTPHLPGAGEDGVLRCGGGLASAARPGTAPVASVPQKNQDLLFIFL